MKRLLFLTLIATATASADHGPGTSGSGFTTITAETLKARHWSASLSLDWTEFDAPPAAAAATEREHFDFIDRSFLTTFSLSFGVTEDFQLGLNVGYYAADGTRRIAHSHEESEANPAHEHERENEHTHEHRHQPPGRHAGEHHGEEEPAGHETPADAEAAKPIAGFDADGWTDLWLTAKHRVYRGAAGSLALLGGVKLPIGETGVRDSLGDRVEPASTPGSGAWDGLAGLAYTVQLAPGVTLDASAQYTFRGEKDDYRLGHRFDTGAALGWRIAGGAESLPTLTLLGEATVRVIGKSTAHGEREADTGGTALFLAPGMRLGFSRHAAWTVGMAFPVAQDLNGTQVEAEHRFTTSLHFAF